MTDDRAGVVAVAVVILGLALAAVFWLTRTEPDLDVALVGPLPTVGAVVDDLPDVADPEQPAPPPASQTASATIDVRDGAVVLGGVVPDTELAATLRDAAAGVFGEGAVVDELRIDGAAAVGPTSTVSIIGTVPDAETGRALVASLEASGLVIDDGLRVAVPAAPGTVAALVTEDSRLEAFTTLLRRAGLVGLLEGDDPVTVFVPRDATMNNLSEATLAALEDPDVLVEVVRRHVVAGEWPTSDLVDGETLTTIDGASLPVVIDDDGTVRVARAVIVIDDRSTGNGVVQVTNRLLLPPLIATQVRINALVLESPIAFSPGSAELLPDSVAVIDRVAGVLVDADAGQVEIQGHTDTDGEAEVNQELSEQRAQAVLDRLVDQGVDADRLTAVGFGETDLVVDPEITDTDKARNRRIEFRVS